MGGHSFPFIPIPLISNYIQFTFIYIHFASIRIHLYIHWNPFTSLQIHLHLYLYHYNSFIYSFVHSNSLCGAWNHSKFQNFSCGAFWVLHYTFCRPWMCHSWLQRHYIDGRISPIHWQGKVRRTYRREAASNTRYRRFSIYEKFCGGTRGNGLHYLDDIW